MNLTELLKRNPVVLNKYVSLGFALVDKTVGPLNKLMHHLLEVQGIDPNTRPGDRTRAALTAAIDGVEDSEEFDKDFDFSRFHSRFQRVSAKLKDLNLSKEKYREMTDLSKLDDKPTMDRYKELVNLTSSGTPALQRTRSRGDTETIAEIESALKKPDFLDPIEDLKQFTAKYYSDSGELNTSALKSALKKLESFAANTERVDANRQPTVVGGTRRTKGRSKVTKSFKNGLFRRVEVK